MLHEQKQLVELYKMKNFHSKNNDNFDYESEIIDKSVSPYLYNNDNMSSFLKKVNKLVSMFFDNFTIIDNFRNYMVDKYKYK